MEALVKAVKNGEAINIGEFSELSSELFEIKLSPKQEFAVANIGNNLVVLDIELTEDLVNEGYLRELIRGLQVCRKEADFDITDRIIVELSTNSDRLQKVIKNNEELIKTEVLAKDICQLSVYEFEKEIQIDGEVIKVKMTRKN